MRPHDNIEYFLSKNRIEHRIAQDTGQPIPASSLERLRRWLAQLDCEDGTRLPPERALADTLDISRPELRKALAILENEGRIARHVGRGTFVTTPPDIPHSAAMLAALTDRTGPHDAMIARLAMEPELAYLAALHATPLHISRAQKLLIELRAATDWETYEKLDYSLHDLIAEATGNVLLHELHKTLNAVRQVVVWRQLSQDMHRPPPTYHSFDEHDAIVTAIANRDRVAARAAMRAHLRSTLDTMTAED